MNLYYRLLFVMLLALAACGSSRSGFRPAPQPQQPTTPKDTVAPEKPRDTGKKGKKTDSIFNVSLLLPLNITTGDYKMDPNIADYYEGMLLGLDTLKKWGLNVVVNVYDTQSDTLAVRKTTWKKEMAESNVIIGPMFKAGYAMISKYAAARKIVSVSPFSNAYMYSDSNYYSLYCSPDEKAYAATLAKHIKHTYLNANIILFSDGSKEDKDFLWLFKVAAREIGLTEWKEVTYGAGTVTNLLEKGEFKDNIIIAPTEKENVASNLMVQLKDIEYNNTLFAFDSWLRFSFTNFQTYQLWEQNHLHLLTGYFVDDLSPETINFKTAYRQRFGCIPEDFAYRGYDHITALGKAFKESLDDSLASTIEKKEIPGLHNTFNFNYNGKVMGNSGVNIIRFQNHRFRRVGEE